MCQPRNGLLKRTLKRTLFQLLRVGVSTAILGFLVVQAKDSLPEIQGQPHWGLLALASLLCLLMVVTTIVRWYLLVRALELPFRLRDAFRLGFLGYMLNFFSLGSVGGDLFRAVFIAREHAGRRAEAVATVFIDRLIGLYALFLVATVAVLTTGLMDHSHESIRLLCRVTLFCTGVSSLVVFFVLTPGFTKGRISTALANLPRIGPTIGKLLSAVRMYRRKLPTLLIAGLMSIAVHSLSATAIYVAAQGLPGAAPGYAAHFLIVPLGMLAAAMPLSLSGLGLLDGVLDLLYVQIPTYPVAVGTGLMVGIAYRAITIGIAIIGFIYYLANRAAVAQVMKHAEAQGETSGEGNGKESAEKNIELPGRSARRVSPDAASKERTGSTFEEPAGHR
ncbi:MAG: lysylphosphatidylglycerol synthase transmembrane domain-containing protein [Gammaproteobacteria bacterium]|nr:lysylphosphatidylglycerol synthase transmembrane domain-containing protein [Gammaproteobacteria bacterium]